MWGVIVPALAAAGFACFFAACIWLVRLFLIAPTGYQDRDGFHLGDQGSDADLPLAGLLDHVRRGELATMVSGEMSIDRDSIVAGARRAGHTHRQSPKRPQRDAAADSAAKRLSKIGARPPKA
ncbi:hypothetical protein [Sphingomonas colocasiae]|uniref:Uncharacterized protein n=1 Tax=Sphingomonas colocasiae TaxID=1848973 RepID=A0ABS7PQJ2_9SPHN|nr:hypothetical protein [Sphingomonas colocasiae]MBY8823601.1 hypothetical protein [Sphingomonas colocasiae]